MSRSINVTIAVIVAVAMFAVPAIAAFDGACSSADADSATVLNKPDSAGLLESVSDDTAGGEIFYTDYDTGWTFGPNVGSLKKMAAIPSITYHGVEKPAYGVENKEVIVYLLGESGSKDTLTSSKVADGNIQRLLTVEEGCTLYLENVILLRGTCSSAMVNVLGTLVIGDGVEIKDGDKGNGASLMTSNNGRIIIEGGNLGITGGIGMHDGTESSGVTIKGEGVRIGGNVAGNLTIGGANAAIAGNVEHAIVNASGATIEGTAKSVVVNNGGGLAVDGAVKSLELKGGIATANSVDKLVVNEDCAFEGNVGNLVVLSGTVTFTGKADTLSLSGGVAKVNGTVGTVSVTGGSELIGHSVDEKCTVNGGITVNINDEGVFSLGNVIVDTEKTARGMEVRDGAVVINDGSIFQNNAVVDNDGGAILLSSGSELTMNGGEITGNTATMNSGGRDKGNGGAVAVYSNAKFIMNGGEISGNTASVTSGAKNSGNGGAVYVAGEFVMEGGVISGNNALNGGAVRVNSEKCAATFTMTGGEISENLANDNGGAVSVRYHENNVATFTMTGGEIKDNRAGLNAADVATTEVEGHGGAVHLFNANMNSLSDLAGSIMNFNGGTISGNKALNENSSAIALKDNAAKLVITSGEFGDDSSIYISHDEGEYEATIEVYNKFDGEVRIVNQNGGFDLVGTGSDRGLDGEPDVIINGISPDIEGFQPGAEYTFTAGDEKVRVTCHNGDDVKTYDVYVNTSFSSFLEDLDDTTKKFVGWYFDVDGTMEVEGDVQENVDIYSKWEDPVPDPVQQPGTEDDAQSAGSEDDDDSSSEGYNGITTELDIPDVPIRITPALNVTIDGVERSLDLGTTLKVGAGTDSREGMTFAGWNVNGTFVPVGGQVLVAIDTEIASVWEAETSAEVDAEESGLATEASSIGGMGGVAKTMMLLLLVLGGLYVVKRELA